MKIIPNQWNTIEATVDGDHFVVVFNGKKVADGHDAKRASGHSACSWRIRKMSATRTSSSGISGCGVCRNVLTARRVLRRKR